jgi:dTMP kinase
LPLAIKRDRFEEADESFFERVATGYHAIAAQEPKRFKLIAASGTVEAVAADVWRAVEPLLGT